MSPRLESRHRDLTAQEAPVTTVFENPDQTLLVTALRRAIVEGWTRAIPAPWAGHRISSDHLTRVETFYVEGLICVWRRTHPGEAWGTPDEYMVTSVRQGVDVLVALGILPVDLSSQYAAGVAAASEGGAEVYDRDGDLWRLSWHCAGSDGPPLTRTQLDGEFGPLTAEQIRCTVDVVEQPCGWLADGRVHGQPVCILHADQAIDRGEQVDPLHDEQPGPVCATPVPDAPHLTCGTTAVGTIAAAGNDVPVCRAHAEVARAAGLIVHPLDAPPARLTPAERIAEVARIAPEYVRPVDADAALAACREQADRVDAAQQQYDQVLADGRAVLEQLRQPADATDQCTHGGDCQVHPDARQLHNFDHA